MKNTMDNRYVFTLWTIALLATTLTSCSQSYLPIDLMGVWITDDERYQQCYMKIDENSIVFGNKQGPIESGIVQKITLSQKDSAQIFNVQYENQNGIVFTLNIVFCNKSGGTMWFQHQPQVVWRRQSPSMSIVASPQNS
jgi:hypothetical protein